MAKPSTDSQTAEHIFAETKDGLKKYNLLKNDDDKKLYFNITTDNAKAEQKAMKMSDEVLEFDNSLGCLDHTLHLNIENGLTETTDIQKAVNPVEEELRKRIEMEPID